MLYGWVLIGEQIMEVAAVPPARRPRGAATLVQAIDDLLSATLVDARRQAA